MKKRNNYLLALLLAFCLIFSNIYPSYVNATGIVAENPQNESFVEVENWAREKMDEITAIYTEETQTSGTKDWWKIAELGKLNIEAGENDLNFLKEQAENASDKVNIYTKNILALRAQGIDPTNYYGIDLVTDLTNENIQNRGIWSWAPAVSALNSDDYEIDEFVNNEVTELLAARKTSGNSAGLWDTWGWQDATGFALYAIAPQYETRTDVEEAVDEVVNAISEKKLSNGNKIVTDNCNSLAMVLGGIASNDPELVTDPRLARDGYTMLHELKEYDIEGGFKWLKSDTSANAMATEQAYRALITYFSMKQDNGSVFDYRGTEKYIIGQEVDKSALEAKYNEVKDLTQGNYTDESWHIFEEARTEARTVLEDPNAQQENVDQALDNLINAIESLEINNNQTKKKMLLLTNLYNAVENITREGYERQSWRNFKTARINAKKIIDRNEQDYDIVNQAYIDLKLAFINLKESDETLFEQVIEAMNEFYARKERWYRACVTSCRDNGDELTTDLMDRNCEVFNAGNIQENLLTPKKLAHVAIEDDVDCIFLELRNYELDGQSCNVYAPALIEALKEYGRDDMQVYITATGIEEFDNDYLSAAGVGGLFEYESGLDEFLLEVLESYNY